MNILLRFSGGLNVNLKTISNAPVGTTKVIKRVLLLWLACCLLIFIASCSQADEGTLADTTAASSF